MAVVKENLRPVVVKALTDEVYEHILATLTDGAPRQLEALLKPLHASDVGELLERLPLHHRQTVFEHIPREHLADVLAELPEGVQKSLLEEMSPDEIGRVLDQLNSDDAADLLQNLDREIAAQVARTPAVTPEEKKLLQWPEDSAGGIMQVETLTVPPEWSVGQVLQHIRDHSDACPESFYRIFVVDGVTKLLGAIALSRLVKLPLDARMDEVMNKEPVTVPPDMPQEEVARQFAKYDLHSCPVVDADRRLLGCITIDDVLDVVAQERERDFMRSSGVDEGEDLFAPVAQTAQRRFLWLFINLLTAILAAAVIALFEDQIARLVVLAVLMPIVASMGGNAGTQTLAVVVQALARKQITAANALFLMRKELMVGGFNGVVLGVVIGVGTVLLYDDPVLGAVICAATFINLILAALSGYLVPVIVEKMGGDPAISSGVLVTTVTDVGGFFAFLGLATLLLL